MDTKLTYTVDEAAKAISIGRVKFYELLNKGEVKAVKIGSRTVIRADDLKAYVDGLPSYAA